MVLVGRNTLHLIARQMNGGSEREHRTKQWIPRGDVQERMLQNSNDLVMEVAGWQSGGGEPSSATGLEAQGGGNLRRCLLINAKRPRICAPKQASKVPCSYRVLLHSDRSHPFVIHHRLGSLSTFLSRHGIVVDSALASHHQTFGITKPFVRIHLHVFVCHCENARQKRHAEPGSLH